MEGRLSSGEAADQATKVARNLKTARQQCEVYTRRQLIKATWILKLDSWRDRLIVDGRIADHLSGTLALSTLACRPPAFLAIPLPPLLLVNSIKYLDGTGAQQTWATASYRVEAPTGPMAQHGRISLASGQSWPTVRAVTGAIEIDFDAGYGAAATDVPEPLVDGIIARAQELYDFRGNVVVGRPVQSFPLTSERLWDPFVVGSFGE